MPFNMNTYERRILMILEHCVRMAMAIDSQSTFVYGQYNYCCIYNGDEKKTIFGKEKPVEYGLICLQYVIYSKQATDEYP